jgi:phage shock protein A
MWERTKRLINSYLDDLIERTSGPDRDIRQITRAEIARLNELEVQARASVKMLEKELAEVELKMIGLAERQRIAVERGDAAGASSASSELVSLSSHRDFLKQQISEANSSAARAQALREQRRTMGNELANETYMTSMRENLAGIQSPFDKNDPSATIDEMRARLSRYSEPSIDSRVADAERELEAQRARSQVDDMLARYKQSVNDPPATPRETVSPSAQTQPTSPAPSMPATENEEPEQPKSLGRNEGPVRPID